MNRYLVVAVISGLVLTACLQEEDKKSDPSVTEINTCFGAFGAGAYKYCMEFPSIIPQADRAEACAEGTPSADTTCPKTYQLKDSNGVCALDSSGIVINYRFYEENATLEQALCNFLESESGGAATATWKAD